MEHRSDPSPAEAFHSASELKQMPSSVPAGDKLSVAAILPVRDDWPSARELLRMLDEELLETGCSVEITLVDDASMEGPRAEDFAGPYSCVHKVRVLRLRRNLGHQRAIAIGLVHVDTASAKAVLIMDADGEDTPEGARTLITAFISHGGRHALFAERRRRTESVAFRLFYIIYKIVHWALTGVRVRVGNFSVLPSQQVGTLIVMGELWNHYSAAYFRSGQPFMTVPIPRGYRLFGRSRMSFVALVMHGLSAISVFGDVVGVRLLIATMFGAALGMLGVLCVVGVRTLTDWAVPGWATYTVGLLVVFLLQCIILAASFTFTLLANRASLTFVPGREPTLFVESIRDVYPHD
jgi:glycosyltransferase involved in cell wall biosynthesis